MHSDSPQRRSQARPFEHITSTGNDLVKLMRSLERKKVRTETGLFLAEGARHCTEAMQAGWTPVHVLAGEAGLDRPVTLALLQEMAAAGARVITGSEKVLEATSRKDNPQTVIATFKHRQVAVGDLPVTGRRRWVALYEVRDPGNLGTILRTADAVGVDGVLLIGTCCDPYSHEAVRASMGSIFAAPFVAVSEEAFWRWVEGADARVVAGSMRGTVSTSQETYGERSVLLMGNEQAGLPPETEARCDQLVRLPMRGHADSLNLASASAVMMYDVWRASGFEGMKS